MYLFSNMAFFFYNSDYVQDYYDPKEDYLCKSLIFCFLTALDSGLRARGGLGDSAKRISFLRDPMHYIGRLICDDLFFLLIVIIMIDMVFGIIVQSFVELRHRTQKYQSDKINRCFICNVGKNTLERYRINFVEHINDNHYLWNYVEYIIKLDLADSHDLNAINNYAKLKIEQNDISWLPTSKDFELETNKKGKSNGVDDLSFQVPDEGNLPLKVKDVRGTKIGKKEKF